MSAILGFARFREFWSGKLGEMFGLDVRSLALFRVALALLLLYDLGERATALRAHYTDAGVMPRRLLPTTQVVSLHFLSGSSGLQIFLFAISAAAAVALLVGWRTRAATAVAWFLTMSLQARNPLVLNGGDTLLRQLLFWSLFLPLGAYASIDSRDKPLAKRQCLSMASVALILQLCFVYWFAGLLKSDPIWRQEGSAIFYALSIDSYTTSLGKQLLEYPALCRMLSFATPYFEMAGPALLFIPWASGPLRVLVIVTFVLFHVGLTLCLELGLFPVVCLIAWLALLPGWFWDRLPVPKFKPTTNAPRPGILSWQWNLAASVFIIYVAFWNVRTLNYSRWQHYFPPQFNSLGTTFGLNQHWGLFAPCPMKTHGWYVAQGQLEDGSTIDVAHEGQPVVWERPDRPSAEFPNHRWRKYQTQLVQVGTQEQRVLYAQYLCRQWNRVHQLGPKVERVEVYFMKRTTRPDQEPSGPEKQLLGKT